MDIRYFLIFTKDRISNGTFPVCRRKNNYQIVVLKSALSSFVMTAKVLRGFDVSLLILGGEAVFKILPDDILRSVGAAVTIAEDVGVKGEELLD